MPPDHEGSRSVPIRPTPTRTEPVSFEDWLITQTATPQPRRRIVQLMLDRRLHEVDFGAHAIRAEFRRMLADFDTATRGQWVRSAPLPFRAACAGHRPVPDRPGDDVND